MASLAGSDLFLLGLASGITLLTITSYRRVSPPWLRRLLMLSGFFVMSRYLAMALLTSSDAPQRFWSLRFCWYATTIGLMLPSVFAVDQLLRHPAMSPKRLLRWCAPFLTVYSAVMVFGAAAPMPDRVAGRAPHLSAGWQAILSIVQGVFVVGFVGLCVRFMRKIPPGRLRVALGGLVLGQFGLGCDGLLLTMGGWYFRPFLYTEMAMLLALWFAYETSATLQQSG